MMLGLELAVTASGNAVVVGHFRATVDFDPGPAVDLRTSEGEADMFIMQFSTDGEVDWAQTMGDSGYDEANLVRIDAHGNIHVAGGLQGVVDLDFGPGEFYLPIDVDSTSAFVMVLDSLGNFVSAFKSNVGFHAFDIDSSRNFYGVGKLQ